MSTNNYHIISLTSLQNEDPNYVASCQVLKMPWGISGMTVSNNNCYEKINLLLALFLNTSSTSMSIRYASQRLTLLLMQS